jgi:hypothetical protein
MRDNSPNCSVSPSCDTKRLPFGKTIAARHKLQSALAELKVLACDEWYQAHGMADYEAKCAELFEIKQRLKRINFTELCLVQVYGTALIHMRTYRKFHRFQ